MTELNQTNNLDMMLDWTGERYLPMKSPYEIGAEIHYEHLHRYLFARHFAKDKKVLDLACGEGYGSYLLAENAESVFGVDIDNIAIQHAQKKYIRNNLKYFTNSFFDAPFENNCFDLIICYEAIEHVDNHIQLMNEINRLINKNGLLIISTPNKAVYSDEPNYSNPYHHHELYFDEFHNLLNKYFNNIWYYGQKVSVGSNIWNISDNSPHESINFFIKYQNDNFINLNQYENPMYYLALASKTDIHKIANINSFCMDTSNTLISVQESQLKKYYSLDNKSDLSFLYLDTGNGFSEAEKITAHCSYEKTKFSLTFTCDPSTFINNYRWDPVEGLLCDVSIKEILIHTKNKKILNINPIILKNNGIRRTSKEYSFKTIDPWFVFKNSIKEICSIEIIGSWYIRPIQDTIRLLDADRNQHLYNEDIC